MLVVCGFFHYVGWGFTHGFVGVLWVEVVWFFGFSRGKISS